MPRANVIITAFPFTEHYCSTCVKKGIIRTLPLCTGIMASISSLSQYTVRSHFLTTRTQISYKTGPIHVYISLLHRTIPKTITGIIVYADGEVIFNTLTRNQWGYSPSLLSLFSWTEVFGWILKNGTFSWSLVLYVQVGFRLALIKSS